MPTQGMCPPFFSIGVLGVGQQHQAPPLCLRQGRVGPAGPHQGRGAGEPAWQAGE